MNTLVRYLLALALVVTGKAVACPAMAIDVHSKLYQKALAQITELPEYKSWALTISKTEGVHVAFDPNPPEEQVLILRRCYIPITLYSDEGTHLHRWNTFYVSVKHNQVLVEDNSGEDPITLSAWRRSNIPVERDASRRSRSRSSP